MNIVYNCDDNYVPWLGASAASLLANAGKPGNVRFFILTPGLSEENERKLKGLAESFGAKLRVIRVPAFEEDLKARTGSLPATGRFGLAALLRLFAPDYLPADAERFLYLDCDLIVRKDPAPLLETDLSGLPAGLCPEPTIYPGARNYLGLPADAPYFNSGVILTDAARWRKENISGRCLAVLQESGGRLPFADQDILNRAVFGKARVLPQKWNFLSNYYYRNYRSLAGPAPWYRSVCTEDAYEEARRDPCIVHFAGAERPWIRGNRNPYRGEFLRYLGMTPWKDTPPVEGKELSMAAYHLMNAVTGVFPPARSVISGLYYRKYMADFRKTGA